MNGTGGLRIATILVVFTLGLSTLAVGVQLSSGGTTASTHNQDTTNPGVQPASATSGMQRSLNGTGDIAPRNSTFSDGISPQDACPATTACVVESPTGSR